jgi:hypothetical protein
MKLNPHTTVTDLKKFLERHESYSQNMGKVGKPYRERLEFVKKLLT